ncbi:MAG: hypothetical protein HDR74_06905 [Bacteroides sp.]|nr:hypothetical protein [Bacteroides sp.]
MKDSLILLIIGFLIGFSLCGLLSKCNDHQDAPDISTVSVKVIHDTILDTVPVPAEVRRVGSVVAKLPLAKDTTVIDSCQHTSDSCQHYADVLIPIEQKVYEDSTYRAVISGYNISLDTIQVFRHREYITERIKPPAKRWGLSAGVGAVVGTDMKVRPGVFVGATYTFLSF